MQLNEQELHREIYYHEEFFLNIISFWKKKSSTCIRSMAYIPDENLTRRKNSTISQLINNTKIQKQFNVLPPITLDFSYGFTFSLFLA